MKTTIIIAVCAAAISLAGIISAQEKQKAEPNRKAAGQPQLDTTTVAQIGEIMSHLLDTIYVSPEIGSQLARRLQEKFAAGGYANASTPTELADNLTSDLRDWANDRHLYVHHNSSVEAADRILTVQEWEKQKASKFKPGSGGAVPMQAAGMPGGGAAPQQSGSTFAAKMLGDGIGYLKVGVFGGGGAQAQIAEAMNTLAASKALIIDLRDCPGGSAQAVSFLASYFFDPEPRVLMNRYFRPTGERVQSTTVSDLPGKRMPDAELYILTSSRTASAGESFAYTLQQYGRAKVVGETTAGAGYNNVTIPIGKGFVFSVSYGRPEHPRSGKGWEAVGVQPDVKVDADQALEAAQKLAARR